MRSTTSVPDIRRSDGSTGMGQHAEDRPLLHPGSDREHEHARKLVASIIQLAHTLGLEPLAGGSKPRSSAASSSKQLTVRAGLPLQPPRPSTRDPEDLRNVERDRPPRGVAGRSSPRSWTRSQSDDDPARPAELGRLVGDEAFHQLVEDEWLAACRLRGTLPCESRRRSGRASDPRPFRSGDRPRRRTRSSLGAQSSSLILALSLESVARPETETHSLVRSL